MITITFNVQDKNVQITKAWRGKINQHTSCVKQMTPGTDKYE